MGLMDLIREVDRGACTFCVFQERFLKQCGRIERMKGKRRTAAIERDEKEMRQYLSDLAETVYLEDRAGRWRTFSKMELLEYGLDVIEQFFLRARSA